MDALTRTVLILALVALVLFFLVYGASIFIPLAVALLLWFFINALARAFRKAAAPLAMPRALALILALVTIFAVSLLVINLLVANIASMGQQAANFNASLNLLTEHLASLAGVRSQEVTSRILAMVQIDTLVSYIVGGMASLASQFTIVFIYVLFLLIEQRLFDLKLRAVVPNEEKRSHFRAVLRSIAEDVQGYLWIMTLVSVLNGVLCYGVLLLVGVDQAFFWAFLIFVLNFIPTVGSIVATVLPALYALFQFQDFAPFLWVLLGVGAVQFVVGNLVQPKVAAHRLNLSQFVVILSLFAWGAIWGVAGMFLAVPLTAIVMLVFANIEATRPLAMLMSETGNVGRAEDEFLPSENEPPVSRARRRTTKPSR